MSLSARDTTPEVPSHAGVPGEASGRQRRQGRNPSASAAAADGKYRTCSSFGARAGQIGRQYTPVLVTPMKKRPSNRASRDRRARSQTRRSKSITWRAYRDARASIGQKRTRSSEEV